MLLGCRGYQKEREPATMTFASVLAIGWINPRVYVKVSVVNAHHVTKQLEDSTPSPESWGDPDYSPRPTVLSALNSGPKSAQ